MVVTSLVALTYNLCRSRHSPLYMTSVPSEYNAPLPINHERLWLLAQNDCYVKGVRVLLGLFYSLPNDPIWINYSCNSCYVHGYLRISSH